MCSVEKKHGTQTESQTLKRKPISNLPLPSNIDSEFLEDLIIELTDKGRGKKLCLK